VYEKAELLFDKLEDILRQLSPWTSLNFIDIEAYIDAHFKQASDWENNYKSLRDKRKELENIQEFYKVDCFKIKTDQFKKGVEDILNRMHDAIRISLKTTIKSDM